MSFHDFVIIGGGPAGATAAALLAQRGLRTLLCEQKTFPRPKVCGEFVSARARPILRQLGLESDFDRLAGPPIRRLIVCPFGNLALRGKFPARRDSAFPRALARDQFDDLLLRRARQLGATILQPCHATSIAGSLADGFQISTDSHGLLHSRAVILAHGLAQRGDMNPASPPPSPPVPARPTNQFISFKTHFTDCDLPDDTIAIASAPGMYAGLVRTSDLDSAPRYSLAFVIRRSRLDRIGNSAEAQFHDLLAHNPAFAALIGPDHRRLSPWLASGPLQPGIRHIYQAGRFFVGNAAGEVHALVGEGMTLALHSASLLAAAVETHGISEGAGQAYARRWRRAFVPRHYAANLFTHAMMRPSLAAPLARFIRAIPPLMNWCIRATGQGA